MCTQDYEGLNDSKSIKVHTVYNIATSMETEENLSTTEADYFIYKQAKDPHCRQGSSTVGLPGSMLKYDRKGF